MNSDFELSNENCGTCEQFLNQTSEILLSQTLSTGLTSFTTVQVL